MNEQSKCVCWNNEPKDSIGSDTGHINHRRTCLNGPDNTKVVTEEELQAEYHAWDEEVNGEAKRAYFEEAREAVDNRTANKRRNRR